MPEVKIITNNVPREIASWLPPEMREGFEYINFSAIEKGEDSASFVRYDGQWFDLNNTESRLPGHQEWWYISVTYFYGYAFKLVDDGFGDFLVICGKYQAE